jgi:hypothetical protein
MDKKINIEKYIETLVKNKKKFIGPICKIKNAIKIR